MQPRTIPLLLLTTLPLLAQAGTVDFQRHIQPIFAEHCLECHGADTAKGGIALTSLKAATKRSSAALKDCPR